MNYRIADAGDIETIAALHTASWQRTYRGIYRDDFLDGPVAEERLAVWKKRLAAPPANQHVLLAEEAGLLHGFACAYGADDRKWGTLLDNLHVRHETKRRGVGRALMGGIAAWTAEHYPECSLYLWVLAKNTNARGFYERLGAENVEAVVHSSPVHGTFDSLRYAWRELAPLLAFGPQ